MLIDIEDGHKDVANFHLAGVIPVAGQKLDFQFPWHDSMMPVANNLLAVEHAILQAASAGCESIWVVCHREQMPLLRHRIGDWIYDPSSIQQSQFGQHRLREISIFYVPIHPKDRDRRDCLAWSVIYGSLRAFHLSKMISRWIVPDKYFVVFPYGLNDLQSIFKSRSLISSPKNFYMTYNGKTIRDGEYLPFTFDKEDFKKFRRVIREEGTGVFQNVVFDREAKRLISQDRLPYEKQYSARAFTLDKVFGCATIEGNHTAPTAWHYRIDTWEKYIEYLSTYEAKNIVSRPKYFKYHEWNPLGYDKEDLEE
jgi:hypothetical protein